MKAEVYKIFNDIQTGTNTNENLKSFVSIYEKNNITKFNEAIENVFLIILKNYEKNNVVLKNIKEFLKLFLEKIIKITKLIESTKCFLNHFCKLFINSVKKPKYKTLCIYFLNILLIPYSNNHEAFYESTTLEDIKIFILTILRGKQTSLHFAILKLLQKHTILQKEKDVWERLEALLNNSTQVIKKEILKLLQIDNQNILNYLLEMYDDDAIEIRNFVYEKLSEITNFDLLESSTKVKLFYVGLGDNSSKVQNSAKKFLKNYLNSLGIYKKKTNQNNNNNKDDENRMLVDDGEEEEAVNENSLNKKFSKTLNIKKDNNDSEDENENDNGESIHDKILKSSSPIKKSKKKLTDSPSRVFDKLEIRTFYNHPKFSYTFQLITEAIIEFTLSADLLEYLRNIIDNLTLVSNSQSEMKFLSSEKKRRPHYDSGMSTEGKFDKYAMFNDIFFLQNCIKYFANKVDENSLSLKNSIFELLPDNKTYAKILNHFYRKETNIMILHQLFLIAFHLQYSDEIGNREMIIVLKSFVSDLSLENITMTDYSFRPLNFTNLSQPDEIAEFNNEEINNEGILVKAMENILLPPSRKTIMSMEDLIEHALKILHRIHYNQHNQLFTSIMELVNEINEPLEIDKENMNNLSILKAKQKDILDRIKDKMATIGMLEEKKNKDKNRLEMEKKIKNAKADLESLDEELFNLMKEEKNILCRKLKLCDFLIKYCQLPVNMFENMVETIILPTLSRKDFPEVFKLSYNAMGLLAINFFSSNYRNFLKLFYDQIEKSNPEFNEFEMLSLLIIFDSILQNNISEVNFVNGPIEEKIDLIIKKYLYHKSIIPRVIAFTGLCKLLIANRIARPEFVLARLISVLHKSFDLTERINEDFHVKIFEIMQNFLYAYCYAHNGHIKSVIKAVLIILTAQMTGETSSYERSVSTDFIDCKVEFLNQFIMIVNDFASGQSTLRKIIFKIFKYLFFMYKYASGDFDKAVENDEEEKAKKKFDIKYKSKNNMKIFIKKFFEKTGYDKYLLHEMGEETNYVKLFSFMLCFDYHVIKSFSEPLAGHIEELKEKNYVYEYSGNKLDLGNEDKQSELKEIVSNKENKYYRQIEDYIAFINTIKNTKLNTIEEESSRIIDDDDNNNSSNNNISNVNNLKGDKRKSNERKNKNNDSKIINEEEINESTNKDVSRSREPSVQEKKGGVKRKASPSPIPDKKKVHKRKK